MISADTAGEPRFQVSGTVATAQVFGVDVDGWKPGETRYVDATAFGWPLRSLTQVKAGRYRVQAMINRYETFKRSDGHTVKLPPDQWEGQQFASKPGNLYSRARTWWSIRRCRQARGSCSTRRSHRSMTSRRRKRST
jgi:hypothetical protein